MRVLGGHAVLTVASRTRPHGLVGTLALADVHRTYRIAPGRRSRAKSW